MFLQDDSDTVEPTTTTSTSMSSSVTSTALITSGSGSVGSTLTATNNNTISTNIDENANDIQDEAGKKPQLSAEVSFEENHVRIVFQR